MKSQKQQWATFIAHSKSVIFVSVDTQLKIIDHNNYFAELLQTGSAAQGKSLLHFLMPESINITTNFKKVEETFAKVVFKAGNGLPTPLHCSFFSGDQETIIFGEKPVFTHDEIMQKISILNNELVNVTRDLQKKNRELEYANSTIKTLRGILPICSFCKGIRNDQGYWKKLEEYVSDETEAQFSHSICPQCLEENYPEVFDDD